MADIVFKIVAVLLTLGGLVTTALIVFASLIGGVTNRSAAEETIRWALLPAAFAALGVFLCFKAF